MFLKVLRDFSRPHWIDIVQELKSSTGLSVAELARKLKMSYMGVKQHCVDLEKLGYLDTWRRPKPVGRPEKAYRLTKKTDALFPRVDVGFSLDILRHVQEVYGANAPEKLLFNYFQGRGDRYQRQVRGGSAAERAASLAKLRDAEGYRSRVELDPEDGLAMVEYHSLIADLAEEYPAVKRMEETMIGKVLRARVTRTEEQASALNRIVFRVETLDSAVRRR